MAEFYFPYHLWLTNHYYKYSFVSLIDFMFSVGKNDKSKTKDWIFHSKSLIVLEQNNLLGGYTTWACF